MASNPKLKNSILVKIIDAYEQYKQYGYPKDPAIYVITVNRDTDKYIKLILENGNFIPEVIIDRKKGKIKLAGHTFQYKVDSHAGGNKIIFGPEQLHIDFFKE